MHRLLSLCIAVEACLLQMRRDGIPLLLVSLPFVFELLWFLLFNLLLASRDMDVGVVTRFLSVIHGIGVS